VRGILFNKGADSNWKVTWHQDCVIAVKHRQEIEGWGPWSVKAGIPHVRPSANILSAMLAIRIHMDDCPPENGALHVLPGSHGKGFISETEIVALDKRGQKVCGASRGDVLLMRPLLLHASSSAAKPTARRVLHVEFAPSRKLPNGMEWFEIVGCYPGSSGSLSIQ
jgi:ectoine hydroxylase-related dioxygenase (phytanoyl-CoA dioxygenase family)